MNAKTIIAILTAAVTLIETATEIVKAINDKSDK